MRVIVVRVMAIIYCKGESSNGDSSEIHVRYIIIILHYFHQDGDSAASIDLIVEMIHQMKQAAEVCVCYMGAFCSVEVCAVTG